MLTDEQYGRQLGDQLRHEIDDVHAAPDLVRQLRRRQVRRTWTIRAAIATPVAAAAAVAAAIVVTTAGQSAPPQAAREETPQPPTSSSPVQIQNVAYVKEQTLKALGQASQYVIYSQDVYENGHHDTWYDKATHRYRNDVYSRSFPTREKKGADGKIYLPPPSAQPPGAIHLTQSHAVTGELGSDQEIVTVDYDQKTWSVSHMKETGPVTLAAPDITNPEAVRKAITDGTVTLLGNEKVDGLDTLHLQVIGPKREYKIDMWVDSKTYLPVQETAVKSTGNKNEFPESAGEKTKYQWLPRNEENLAKLTLTPPADFKRN